MVAPCLIALDIRASTAAVRAYVLPLALARIERRPTTSTLKRERFRDVCVGPAKLFHGFKILFHDGFATGSACHGRKKNLQQFDDVTRLKYQCRILRP
jgi:hypothetical protein